MNTLDRIAVFNLDFSLWGARTKLHPEDIGIDPKKLPPEKLATFGSMRIFNPDRLNAFNTYKRQAERACYRVGTRFMGGFAVPVPDVRELVAEVKTAIESAERELTQMGIDYKNEVDAWLNTNIEYAVLLRQHLLSWEQVLKKYRFAYQVYQIESLKDFDGTDTGLIEACTGLKDTLYNEIAAEAKSVLNDSYNGKDKVTHRILSPIRRIRKKLDGLAFIDDAITGIVQAIDATIQAMPKTGCVEGAALQQLGLLLNMLAQPDALRQVVNTVANQLTADLPPENPGMASGICDQAEGQPDARMTETETVEAPQEEVLSEMVEVPNNSGKSQRASLYF